MTEEKGAYGFVEGVYASRFLRTLMLSFACGCAFAQFTVTLTFDEFGTGRLTNSAGANLTLPSIIRADPGPGGLPRLFCSTTCSLRRGSLPATC